MNNFTFETLYGSYHCTFDGVTLLVEGTNRQEYQKFSFQVGDGCRLKFKHQRTTGVIKSFTKKFVVISVEGSVKKESFEDFANNNIYLTTCIRIEKNGVGPYQSEEVSPEFKAWRQELRAQHAERRDSGEREHQPTPEQDSHLRDYAHHIRKMTFGFKNFEQMFKWFSLEEIQYMRKEGFEITYHQELKDFAGTLGAYHQVAMFKTKEIYQEVIHSRSYDYSF